MMEKMFLVILLKFPRKFPSVYINTALERNLSFAFVYNKVNFNICYSGAVRTSYTRFFVTGRVFKMWKQEEFHVDAMVSIQILQTCSSKILLKLKLQMVFFLLMNFHPKNISSLYLNAPITGAVKMHQLHMTSAFIEMLDCVENSLI